MNEINIDGLIFKTHNNVKNYWINLFDLPTWGMTYYNEELNNDIKPTYILLIENSYHLTFGHWVYDSAIFLPYYKKIEEKINASLKIFIVNNPKRSYKKLFLDYYGIDNNNIIYCNKELRHNDTNTNWFQRYNVTLPKNNICITTPMVPLTLKPLSISTDNFINRIEYFKNTLKYNTLNNKKKDWLFLPRATKENYKPNDRIINYNYIYKFLEDKNYMIYNVMDTTDLKDQINILRSADNIILDYGASFSVNSLFIKNKNIYLTTPIPTEHLNLPGCYNIIKQIIKDNNVFYLRTNKKYNI